MAESYFELLTEQQEIPTKPFDPLEEIRRLRRMLSVRMQKPELPENSDSPPLLKDIRETEAVEAVPLEVVVQQVDDMQKTLAIWQRSRSRTRSPREGMFRGEHRTWHTRHIPAVANSLEPSPSGIWETLHAGLTALGGIGVIFGILSLSRGLESDLSFGSLICASGAAIVAVGLGGQFFVTQSDAPSAKIADTC